MQQCCIFLLVLILPRYFWKVPYAKHFRIRPVDNSNKQNRSLTAAITTATTTTTNELANQDAKLPLTNKQVLDFMQWMKRQTTPNFREIIREAAKKYWSILVWTVKEVKKVKKVKKKVMKEGTTFTKSNPQATPCSKREGGVEEAAEDAPKCPFGFTAADGIPAPHPLPASSWKRERRE